MQEQTSTQAYEEQASEIKQRGSSRSRRVNSDAFKQFIASGWGPRQEADPEPSGAKEYLPARHAKLTAHFPNMRLVIPAGPYKQRSNDCDYRFRAHSAFAHLTGLEGELEPDAVLVLEPLPVGETLNEKAPSHQALIFFRPQAPRDSEEFYADSTYGEFWVGPRLTLDQMRKVTGIEARDIRDLADFLNSTDAPMAIIRDVDANVEKIFDQANHDKKPVENNRNWDLYLEEMASTIRLIKDAYEVEQMEKAVAVTKEGFENIIRSLPRAVKHWRGERVVEGAFFAKAREEGNGVGYETISAGGNHANTLHWIDNYGTVNEGEMILVDAGVELDSLYTADITRTLPVNGKFSEVQAMIYNAVLQAADAGFAKAQEPGCRFREIHDAAVAVLAENLHAWGVLPVSVQEALRPEGGQHRRWMPHGTSHHLGMDVHDCALACKELYMDAVLEPGMCFTIEPGLYFHKDDQLVPEQMRGLGVRIEDDIIIDPDGKPRRISENIPRTVADVEAWIAQVQA